MWKISPQARFLPLTSDGSATLINGTSDWVYEEELDVRDGFRWSPDSRHIAYWQFDTRGVGIFPLIYNLGAPREIVTGFPYPGLGHYPSVLDIRVSDSRDYKLVGACRRCGR